MTPSTEPPDLWTTPGRVPIGRGFGVVGLVCGLLAAVLWWQDEPGRLFLVGPLETWQLFGILSALAVIGVTGWVFALAWRVRLGDEIVLFLFQSIVIMVVGAAWILAALAGVLFVGLLERPQVRVDAPELDEGYVVELYVYNGRATLALHRGGPFVFERLDVRLPDSEVPELVEDQARVVDVSGAAYLVYPVASDGTEARIELDP